MTATPYKKPRCRFEVLPDGSIKTDGSVRRKLSGTSIGAVFGTSPFSSPFQTACRLLGLSDQDLSNQPAVHTGVVLESVIIDHNAKVHPDIGEFIPAKDVFGDKTGTHDHWKQDFEDPVFGGHVDGFVSKDGEDYILECKTARDIRTWVDGPPEHYMWQVRLYNHFLTHKDKAYFVLGVVTEKDYKDPYAWTPNDKNCLLFEVDIDQEQTAQAIQSARDWYAEYICQNRTPVPDLNDPRDCELLEHLKAISQPTVELSNMLDRLCTLEAEISDYDAGIQAKRDEAKALRESIKDAMMTNEAPYLVSSSGDWEGTLSKTVRVSYDASRMKADGIDTDKYRIESVTYTFKPKAYKPQKPLN